MSTAIFNPDSAIPPSVLQQVAGETHGHAPAASPGIRMSPFERLSRQLQYTSKQIESSVVGVCGSFQAIADRARSTVGRTTSFLSGEDTNKRSFEGLVEGCGRTLIKILETTEEASSISRRAIERMRSIDEASQKISTALAKLEQISRENKMLAMNARIEAAHAGELGAGFAVVAVEVAAQSDRARTVTSEVTRLITTLREMAGSTVHDLQRMNEQDHKRLEQSRREVDQSLDDMRSTHHEMQEMLQGMVGESELLANDIGSAVRELQFQDRVSQQIAHVISDLETMQAKFSSGDGLGHMHADALSDEFSEYTMHEEREVAGLDVDESAEGTVELF